MSAKVKKIFLSAAVLVFWIAVWAFASYTIGLELLLPSPLKVLATLLEKIKTSEFWLAAGLSLLRITAGCFSGVCVGGLLAVLMHNSKIAKTLLAPILHIVKAAPVASFIILALVWIKTDLLPVFISFLMVVPLVCANVAEGINQTDRKLLEVARIYRFGGRGTFSEVWLPSVKPYAVSACRTALGFAWKSGVAAEVICRPDRSIGDELYSSKLNLETAEVIAYTVVVIIISVLLEKLMLRLLKGGKKKNVRTETH